MAEPRSQSLLERIKSILMAPFKRGQVSDDASAARKGGTFNSSKNRSSRTPRAAGGGTSRFDGANSAQPNPRKSDRSKAKSRKVRPK